MVPPEGHLTTEWVAPKDRLSYWSDLVCGTFVELECDSTDPQTFTGSLRNNALGPLQFSTVESVAQTVRRTRQRIAGSAKDNFLLSLQTGGKGIVAQDGRIAFLQPGDFALYDSTRPYELNFEDRFSQVVLQIPRETVASRLIDAEILTAKRVDGRRGSGLLASNFIRQLHDQIGAIDAESVGRLHASAIDLLATALAEQTGKPLVGSEAQLILRRRVCAYIDQHLADHDLNCESVAAAHGISPRHLRKIFETSTLSVSGWIWMRRLEQAKRDLVDPLLSHLSLTAIAYDVGFKDSAHFSRAFKARFGCSPSEWRNGSDTGHH